MYLPSGRSVSAFTRAEFVAEAVAQSSAAPATFTDAVMNVLHFASSKLDGCPLIDVPWGRAFGCMKRGLGRSLHCLPLRDEDKAVCNKLLRLFFALLGWAGYVVVDKNGAFSCTGGVGVTPTFVSEDRAAAAASSVDRLARSFAAPLLSRVGGPLTCPNWAHPTRIAFYFLEGPAAREAVRNTYTFALVGFGGGLSAGQAVLPRIFAGERRRA